MDDATIPGIDNRKYCQERIMSMQSKKVLVTGAGGFIGHHLVRYLVDRGYRVRGVDVKEPEFEPTAAHEFELLDLRKESNALRATKNIDEVYGLAADMGGIGFIETHKAQIVRDNTLINVHTIESARINNVKRFLFTSSACVIPGIASARPTCALCVNRTPIRRMPRTATDGRS